ncbi:cupin domain-containing protein [Paraburkholderia agricolaris]|uniref:cupin domain-containing protein n=1 Tax=Paraburkholderia agricolaris TaxID=2152888 RepID=UPI0038B92524
MPTNNAAPYYSVAHVEAVLETDEVLARVFTLAPGEKIPWHFHSVSTDHYFVLSGVLTAVTDPPFHKTVLEQGARWEVAPGTHHEVTNKTSEPLSFLLLQGTAGYDWIKVER